MSLKFKYYTYIIIVHGILVYLLYELFQDQKVLFILTEAGILLSFFISTLLYQHFVKPFQILKSGKNAINDEDFTIKYNLTGTKETDGLIKVYNEMIDRLRIEKTRTAEQSYFLEDLIENSPLGMIIMDYDQKIVTTNYRAKEFLNGIGTMGKKMIEIEQPLARELAQLRVFEEKIISIDGIKKYKCKNHELIHKGFPRQFIIIEELTSDILLAEKQAYGKVIRMMAHEVNNSMGAVNSILESIKEFGFEEESNEGELKSYLDVAIDRNKMLGKFTNNFAEVIRLPDPLKSRVDLNMIVTKVADYFRLNAKEKDITFELRTYPEPQIILADRIQLEQAFSNMVKNAIESIGREGNIIFTTTPEPVTFVISDNGKGIDDEASEMLFTPFFSTKETGQGIGLMLIRDILNNHEADYKLYTEKATQLTHFEVIFS